MTDQQKVQLLPCPFCGQAPKHDLHANPNVWCNNDACAIVGVVFSGGPRHWNTRQAALAHASSESAEECSVDDHVAGGGKLVSEAVAWMTHHEPPMLFPTREEAAAYCADDEQPLPLYTHPARSAEDATTNPHESSSKLVDAAVLAELTAWLTREMPAGTIIGSPEWLAKRIAGRGHIAIDQAIAGRRGDGHG